MNRRYFLMSSAAAPAALAATKPFSPSDTIRVAVLGVNGRGQSHFSGLQPLPNVQVTTFVDPDLAVGNKRAAQFESKYGHRPKVIQDMRRVFDDKDIDVVTVATPNHWHALATIWACQAGKDVYVEKPGSHSLAQGRSMTIWPTRAWARARTGRCAPASAGTASATWPTASTCWTRSRPR